MLIISGSIPPSLPKNLYEKILALLDGREVYAVVDTSGEALMKTLRYEPFLIKPNHQELEELAQSRLFTREEIIAQGKRLQEMGAKNVLVSLAAEGAVLLTSDGDILFGEAPRGTAEDWQLSGGPAMGHCCRQRQCLLRRAGHRGRDPKSIRGKNQNQQRGEVRGFLKKPPAEGA